jgi:hypothetical protein
MTLFKPQSLGAIGADERKCDILSGPHASLGLASCLADSLGIHYRRSAALALQFPGPTNAPAHYNATTFDARSELPFKGVTIQVRVCCNADLLGADARTLLEPSKAEKPAPDPNGKGVNHRALPGGVVTYEQIEAWIETEFPVCKTVEVLDCEMVNLHLRSSSVPSIIA